MLGLYKHLHTHPELSFQEHDTAQRMAGELKEAGADVTAGVGKLGVVGVLKNGPGPVVLVRTDMDALPVVEETGVPYVSTVRRTTTRPGVPSASCTPADTTSTCPASSGAREWLAEHKDRWSGTVRLRRPSRRRRSVGGAGRCSMMGCIPASPSPISPWRSIARPRSHRYGRYCPGPMLASSTSVDITIRGKGGHGAWPHRTVDPIVLAALVVVDLQTIVSREIDPSSRPW